MHKAESGNVMDIIAGLLFLFLFWRSKKRKKQDAQSLFPQSGGNRLRGSFLVLFGQAKRTIIDIIFFLFSLMNRRKNQGKKMVRVTRTMAMFKQQITLTIDSHFFCHKSLYFLPVSKRRQLLSLPLLMFWDYATSAPQ